VEKDILVIKINNGLSFFKKMGVLQFTNHSELATHRVRTHFLSHVQKERCKFELCPPGLWTIISFVDNLGNLYRFLIYGRQEVSNRLVRID
jgi:hypothetical protein